MDFVKSIVGIVGGEAKRHLGYLIFYQRNIHNMEVKFGELDAIREYVQQRVEAAARERGEEVDCEFEAWLKEVKDADEEVKRIKDTNNKSFLHFRLHHRLGKDAAAQIKAIDDLLEKEDMFYRVSHSRPAMFDRVSHSRPAPSTTGSLVVNYKGYAMFESRESCLNEILDALKDETVHMIGVYGMAGIGKTTLVKEAAKKAMKDGLFTEVVMVTVSQNLNVKKIQTDMAQCLSLQLDDKAPVEVRAGKIEERLMGKEGNRVLVILDDLWQMLELSKVIIPDRNKEGTCTVVITTRREVVCYQMGCKKNVELRTLSDEESWLLFNSRAEISWLLFNSRAEINVVESREMKEVAQNVAKQCDGLPLALVVLGTALKGKKQPEVWKTVLNQLKKSTMARHLPGVSNKVRQSIELSYNFLESEAAKWCFLHCCLYPEDYEIDLEGDGAKDLMHMLVGGGLLEDVESLHEAQDRVHVLMDQLKASGLLIEGREKKYVRMHDVVRDVAIWIGERDHGFFVRTGQGLEEWPRNSTDAKKLQNCRQLSLMFNEIVDLPSDPINCTKLETLILCGNRELSNIPEKFFQHMKALKVLDLSFTNISCLPESLSCLTSLRVLNLKRCEKLRDISPINGLRMPHLRILDLSRTRISVIPSEVGMLGNLRFLNLAYTELTSLPTELGQLAKLAHLDLTCTFSLSVIPHQALSMLSRLQVLYMFGCVYGGWIGEDSEDDAVEVGSWKLVGHVGGQPGYDEKKTSYGGDDERGMGNWKLISYGGDDERGMGNWKLISYGGDDERGMGNWKLTSHGGDDESGIVDGKLISHGGDDERGMGNWKLENAPKTEPGNWRSHGGDDERGLGNWRLEASSSKDDSRQVSFDDLECLGQLSDLRLTLWTASCLARFFKSPVLPKRTQLLHLRYCSGLISIHTSAFWSMKRLRELHIEKCVDVKELIIGDDQIVEDSIPLSIEFLFLSQLPRVKIILNGTPPGKVFQNLRYLSISCCHELKDATWVMKLPCLEELILSGCNGMEHMISDGEEAVDEVALLPRLKRLALINLRKLKFICKQVAMTKLLPKLAELKLSKLPQLESVLQPFQCLPNLMTLEIIECGLRCGLAYHEMEMAATDPFPKLEKLEISYCREMSQMISSLSSPGAPLQGMCIVFQNLRHLKVDGCPRLTHLFWSKQAKHMQQLTSLQIGYCDSLTAVVISNENQEEGASTSTSTSTTTCAVVDHHHGSQCLIFPRLTRLTLIRLPEIVAFHQPTASPMEWPCLKQCEIKECPKLESTPLLGPQTSERSRVLREIEEDSE